MQSELNSGAGPLSAIFFLLKSIAGGIASLFLAWVAIVAASLWSLRNYNAKHGVTGLGAESGGWFALLHSPFVDLILTVAFGIGFYLVARISSTR